MKLYPNCKFYCLNRDTLEYGEIPATELKSVFKNGIVRYYKENTSERLVIVQALNFKKAAAKILTILNNE